MSRSFFTTKCFLFCCLTILFNCSVGTAQKKPELKFNADGKFKIVQLTDIHLKYKEQLSDSAMVMMRRIIQQEKPDLVMLTGDIVCTQNMRAAWAEFSKIFIESKTPWAFLMGNHDADNELTPKEIIDDVVKMPYSLTEAGPTNIKGIGNYVLQVKGSKSNDTKALLYVLDSGDGLPKNHPNGRYEWIDHTQINWYCQQSAAFTKQNKGVPYPALAFFHIPLPEYNEPEALENMIGTREEDPFGGPAVNSGFYNALLESKDVMATFVGHDHDNDYVADLRNIWLVYGQVSGGNAYGEIGRGARMITLYEDQRKFDTWVLKWYDAVRETNSWTPRQNKKPIDFVTYPSKLK